MSRDSLDSVVINDTLEKDVNVNHEEHENRKRKVACTEFVDNPDSETSSSKSSETPDSEKKSSLSFATDSLNESNRDIFQQDDEKRDFVGPIRNSRRRSIEPCGPTNSEATRCARFSGRRDALCDPFRLLIPQAMREQLEQKVERRKTSVTRKVSNFLTVSLDLNRDEELI